MCAIGGGIAALLLLALFDPRGQVTDLDTVTFVGRRARRRRDQQGSSFLNSSAAIFADRRRQHASERRNV